MQVSQGFLVCQACFSVAATLKVVYVATIADVAALLVVATTQDEEEAKVLS